MSYNTKIYKKQGGDELVVNGGKITAAGTQASHITDIADDAGGAAIATAVNGILKALEDVGILADS